MAIDLYTGNEEPGLPPLEATRLRDCFCVRPKGALGTVGWINGLPWEARFVKASSEREAIAKVRKQGGGHG